MNRNRFMTLFFSLGLFCLLAGCQVGGSPAETPTEVTEAFYIWYIDYVGAPVSREMHNPQVDRSYRLSPYLTTDFITQVDLQLNSTVGIPQQLCYPADRFSILINWCIFHFW